MFFISLPIVFLSHGQRFFPLSCYVYATYNGGRTNRASLRAQHSHLMVIMDYANVGTQGYCVRQNIIGNPNRRAVTRIPATTPWFESIN